MSNGTRYGVELVQVEEEDHLPHFGQSNTWEDFVSKQLWMQRLLEGVYFLDGDLSLFAICKEFEKHDGLLAVLDGSVIFHNMSYDWVVATPDGRILVWSVVLCNRGGNSLRAEGVGMLSVTVFFALTMENTLKEPLLVTFVSDNQELINRCNAHLQYIIPYPNDTVKLEYNVMEQIYCTASNYKLKPSYHWVKGHQDDNTPTEELSIVAQLNVEADSLAGEF